MREFIITSITVMEVVTSHAYVMCCGGERPLITAIYKKNHRIIDFDLLEMWQTAF
jgi:iron-sulfur cluster repair protein YtfE (RIC family)